jgi:flagella basal body P-ring formation protein FlgA
MKTEPAEQNNWKSLKTEGQMGLFCLLIILLFSGAPFPCHAFDITFRPNATVTAPSVTLKDIADLESDSDLAKSLASQIVASSPDAGQKISLDSRSVIKKLSHTITTPDSIKWGGTEVVTVERAGITLTSKNVQEIIDAYLTKQTKELPAAQYTFTPKDPPLPFIVPVGDIKWEVTPSNPGIIGSSRFSLIGRIDNQVVKNFSVRGCLEALAQVAVARVNLQRDDIITETQFHMDLLDLSTLKTPCLQPTQVVGKKLLRNINAGTVIDLAFIEIPPVVKKGAAVKIISRKNGLELTATGIAKTDGQQGQVIKVTNTSSAKDIFCRVTAPGLVEVQI